MFKITIEGNEIIPTNSNNYKSLCRGINIIEWLKLNNNNFPKAAIFFDFHENSLRKKICKLRYRPNKKKVISRSMLERGIIEHMETKSIKNIVKETGFHRMAISTGMRRLGYDFVNQEITVKPKNKQAAWQNILYNPILSYIGEPA